MLLEHDPESKGQFRKGRRRWHSETRATHVGFSLKVLFDPLLFCPLNVHLSLSHHIDVVLILVLVIRYDRAFGLCLRCPSIRRHPTEVQFLDRV